MGDIMEMQINKTPTGTKEYPMHSHQTYEVMMYLEGKGYLKTESKNYPFEPGTILIVPPGMMHGSKSINGFCNISMSGSFEDRFHFSNPISLMDNGRNEGKLLAELLYDNRYGNAEYLSGLCSAYIGFLLQNVKEDDEVTNAVHRIMEEITRSFCDCNLTEILRQSGYAEDYIRAQFKKCTGKTPGTFLTQIRMKQACFLIEVYAGTMSLNQIAEKCGYQDYAYFSKRFREICGVSPRDYMKMCGGRKGEREEFV